MPQQPVPPVINNPDVIQPRNAAQQQVAAAARIEVAVEQANNETVDREGRRPQFQSAPRDRVGRLIDPSDRALER